MEEILTFEVGLLEGDDLAARTTELPVAMRTIELGVDDWIDYAQGKTTGSGVSRQGNCVHQRTFRLVRMR